MNRSVNSVPPAKSMPRRKPPPGRAIEMMPGMMMIREIRKKRLRRLTMSSFRMRGSRGGGSALTGSETTSSGGSSSSGDSSTIHPKEARPPECAGVEDDRQQVVGDDDRGNETCHDSASERDRESLHLRRPDEAEDHARHEGRRIGIPDGRPSAPDGRIDGSWDRPAGPDLFFEPLEDQYVGVDGHTH